MFLLSLDLNQSLVPHLKDYFIFLWRQKFKAIEQLLMYVIMA